MSQLNQNEESLIEKIRRLPPDKAVEVEDFVDFLHRRDDHRRLVQAASTLSGDAFRRIWDNSDDAVYDQL